MPKKSTTWSGGSVKLDTADKKQLVATPQQRAFTASRELDSILPKVYDNYLANSAGTPRAPTGAQAFARFKMQVGAA